MDTVPLLLTNSLLLVVYVGIPGAVFLYIDKRETDNKPAKWRGWGNGCGQ